MPIIVQNTHRRHNAGSSIRLGPTLPNNEKDNIDRSFTRKGKRGQPHPAVLGYLLGRKYEVNIGPSPPSLQIINLGNF